MYSIGFLTLQVSPADDDLIPWRRRHWSHRRRWKRRRRRKWRRRTSCCSASSSSSSSTSSSFSSMEEEVGGGREGDGQYLFVLIFARLFLVHSPADFLLGFYPLSLHHTWNLAKPRRDLSVVFCFYSILC